MPSDGLGSCGASTRPDGSFEVTACAVGSLVDPGQDEISGRARSLKASDHGNRLTLRIAGRGAHVAARRASPTMARVRNRYIRCVVVTRARCRRRAAEREHSEQRACHEVPPDSCPRVTLHAVCRHPSHDGGSRKTGHGRPGSLVSCRSTAGTHADGAAAGSDRAPSRACTRSRCAPGPR